MLEALGIRREEIFSDFMLSNEMLRSQDRAAEIADHLNREFGTSLSAEDVLVFAGVRREWLEAMFDRLEERFGSAEAYPADRLGLGPGSPEMLRRLYLEPDRAPTGDRGIPQHSSAL